MRKTYKGLKTFGLMLYLISFTFFVGCKKEFKDHSNDISKKENLIFLGQKVNGDIIIPSYKASNEAIATFRDLWLKNNKSQSVGFRGSCGQHISENIMLIEAESNGCSGYNMTYKIWSNDWAGSTYNLTPISATFTNYYNTSLNATLLDSNLILVNPNCDAWLYDGLCEIVREYTYKVSNVTLPSNQPLVAGNFSLSIFSGFSESCSPITASGSLPGVFNYPTYYSNNPARVYVPLTGNNGSIFISTDCSLLCFEPYLCPAYGTFNYWKRGVNDVVTISSSGSMINNLTPGIYYYSVTLTYIINGNTVVSLPRTGSFQIL